MFSFLRAALKQINVGWLQTQSYPTWDSRQKPDLTYTSNVDINGQTRFGCLWANCFILPFYI